MLHPHTSSRTCHLRNMVLCCAAAPDTTTSAVSVRCCCCCCSCWRDLSTCVCVHVCACVCMRVRLHLRLVCRTEARGWSACTSTEHVGRCRWRRVVHTRCAAAWLLFAGACVCMFLFCSLWRSLHTPSHAHTLSLSHSLHLFLSSSPSLTPPQHWWL